LHDGASDRCLINDEELTRLLALGLYQEEVLVLELDLLALLDDVVPAGGFVVLELLAK